MGNIETVPSVEVALLRHASQIADSVAHIFAVAAWRAVEGSTGRPVGDSADGLCRAMRHACWSWRRLKASICRQAGVGAPVKHTRRVPHYRGAFVAARQGECSLARPDSENQIPLGKARAGSSTRIPEGRHNNLPDHTCHCRKMRQQCRCTRSEPEQAFATPPWHAWCLNAAQKLIALMRWWRAKLHWRKRWYERVNTAGVLRGDCCVRSQPVPV